MIGPDPDSIGKISLSLVHISVGMALIPSCVDAEQVSVNGSPASVITEVL